MMRVNEILTMYRLIALLLFVMSLCPSVALSLCSFVAPSLRRSLPCRFFAPSLFCSICRSFAPSLFRSVGPCSVALLLHPQFPTQLTIFLFYRLYFNIQTYHSVVLHSVALSICCPVALFICRSIDPSLFALSLFLSVALLLHPQLPTQLLFFYFLLSILIHRIIHTLAWDALPFWQCSGFCWIAVVVPAVRQRGR